MLPIKQKVIVSRLVSDIYHYRVTNLGSQALGGISINDRHDQVAGAAVQHHQVTLRAFAKDLYHARDSRLAQMGAELGRLTQVFDTDVCGHIAKMVDVDDLTTPAFVGVLGLGQVQEHRVMDRLS
jgi:hypothetical protein